MQIRLIQRNKATHLGIGIRGMDDKVYVISACRQSWYADDTVSVGVPSDITCKRCSKLAAEAEANDGKVYIGKKHRH